MGIPDLKDTCDLGRGYECREYKYPYDNIGYGLMAVDWEERINFDRMRKERLAKAQKAVKDAGVDALFTFRLENIRHQTGFRVHDWPMIFMGLASTLLINGQDPWLFSIDIDHVKLRMPSMNGRVLEGPLLETNEGVRRWCNLARELLSDAGIKEPTVVGVDAWNQAIIEELPKAFPKTKFVDGQAIMIEARKCKTVDEINCLKMVADVTAAGYQAGLDFLKPGVKECEVLGVIWNKMTALGSEWTQCANVVCSGPYTAPYRRFTSDRIIQHGDLVIIDVGGRVNGYYGDFTRTWICGASAKPHPKQVEFHKRAREAMHAAQEAIKPGALSTDVFEAAGEAGRIGGILGHGLGLAAFEPPLLVPESVVPRDQAYVLEPGMVFSVEPYVGEPGIGGFRLEDNVVVTDNGIDIISRFPYEYRFT